MSDKIEVGKLCGVLQSKFLCLSQSESRTQPCHVRINFKAYSTGAALCISHISMLLPIGVY